MPARNRNFVLRVGDSFIRQINLKPGPESQIAGYSAALIILNDDGSTLHSANTTNTELVTYNGYIDLKVPHSVINGMSMTGLSRSGTVTEPAPDGELPFVGTGKIANYSMSVTNPDGDVFTLLTGQIVFDGS